MKLPRYILLLVFSSVALHAQPPLTVPGRDLYPILPYIYFDSGSAEIPARYIRFGSTAETHGFVDTLAGDDALEQHRRILDIIGYRLRRFPAVKITVAGYDSQQNYDSQQKEEGENQKTAEARARVVRDYLINVWQIDSSRVRLERSGGWPQHPSNKVDPIGRVENRRVEISSDDWEIMRPIFRWRAAAVGPHLISVDRYWFVFWGRRYKWGHIDQRMTSEYLYPNIGNAASITVTGHTDAIGLDDRNLKMSQGHAEDVRSAIRWATGRKDIPITATGMGESMPPFPLDSPEGRCYSRCVFVEVMR